MPRKPRQHTTPPTGPSDQQRRLESRTEDAQVIQAALRGDDRAYRALMTKYHDAISSFIFRMIHDREQVEDLTQEAFIKAFASLRSFNREYAFSTWLYKIATNNCIDYIRKRKLQTFSIDKPIESKDGDFRFELADDSFEADRELIRNQRARLLTQAIEELPDKYRKVIQLRHIEERSYEEIARQLRLPIGTVKAHIFRARELLNRHLRSRIRHY